MTLSFRRAAIAGSSICLALAALFMGAPQFILWVWQINVCPCRKPHLAGG